MICNQYQAYYQVIDDALSDYKCPLSAVGALSESNNKKSWFDIFVYFAQVRVLM